MDVDKGYNVMLSVICMTLVLPVALLNNERSHDECECMLVIPVDCPSSHLPGGCQDLKFPRRNSAAIRLRFGSGSALVRLCPRRTRSRKLGAPPTKCYFLTTTE